MAVSSLGPLAQPFGQAIGRNIGKVIGGAAGGAAIRCTSRSGTTRSSSALFTRGAVQCTARGISSSDRRNPWKRRFTSSTSYDGRPYCIRGGRFHCQIRSATKHNSDFNAEYDAKHESIDDSTTPRVSSTRRCFTSGNYKRDIRSYNTSFAPREHGPRAGRTFTRHPGLHYGGFPADSWRVPGGD